MKYVAKFIKEYLPHTMELGRSFVQPDYQSSKMGSKSLFALDNLWDGLGALIHLVKDARYFIGKVTIYNNYPEVAIVGVNKLVVRPVWDGTTFVPRKMMNLSSSFDHRVIDGWDAAVFVQRLKELLENPATLFVDI